MNISLLHIIHEQHFWLSAQRSIYWEEQKTMIVSDTHFGKTGHFRKSGIAVPQQVYKEDLQRFFSLATELKPERILVVGDFFHSTNNEEHNLFLRWKNDFNSLQITLIKGNHDILGNTWYENAGIQLIEDFYEIGQFRFQHDPAENDYPLKANSFIFSGHVHPGILIKGIGKQSLRFPCFYFRENQCILPAFSKFSGLALVKPKKQDQVYAIANDNIIKLT
ncbi:MAG TPA: ligase-associated DNA damage response endonuclease PdeM [Sediminibacterium sp.]|jgi:DNA ligase-associated metallophosphoesterase|uniref:ligase-associated DNA damage response endonuclease PdeM n=1 Tax=Sediminibacterium sp. TaxID=1917865 RepID=UPI0008B38439|nr:ligase-associated DNA damage response endonuclease PdeM [Sediminibacterium sp.]OHC85722.1 MAG: metallophosphoesterase [Sphingobacteriia bacterium RIFOXYC2_FULL_35_18]OHC87258.1 MAG: metallophosphoesterase [Sphingobacteriia bacterium RIFOXYD2_FULL_35_12]OYY10240.1 MAG: metallophosphoesterase [Sphingobacteriia bacterium 35-36-14]OYZ52888.1 MAG: metallophosphoesterase [Sphingobacteriia bacterium 24-36-13]OZA64535.1 MAG: metallophosphoesterase [Sphingobacteriia bacterium 39-36-14]